MFVMIGAYSPTVEAAAKAAAKTSTQTTKTPDASLQSVAQSYDSKTALQQGLIVQLDGGSKTNVKLVTYKDAAKTFGVVVGATSAAVSLSSSAAAQQAYVVTAGRYEVLVSNQNGAIQVGDWIAASAADGIGMKADNTESTVLGRAVTAFDGKKNVISTSQLKNSSGQQTKVAFGAVQVDIGVKPSPVVVTSDNGVPPVIQKLATSLVGKPISAGQLWASAAILLVGFGIMGSLMYGGVQTGMTAISRNPLARKSILRSMMQVVIISFMIFLGCLVAVYMVLKL